MGDVIEAVDKESIESLSELNELILGKEPGDRIQVRVARGDDQVDVRVRLSLVDSPLPGTLDPDAAAGGCDLAS